MSIGGVSSGAYAEPTPVAGECIVFLRSNSGIIKRELGVWSILPYDTVEPFLFTLMDGDPDFIFASNGELTSHSVDRGQTWIEHNYATLLQPSIHDIGIWDTGHLYLANFSSGDPTGDPDVENPGRIWESTDLGVSWNLILPGFIDSNGFYGLLVPRFEVLDYGGGIGSIYYTDWQADGPDDIELHTVELPGATSPVGIDTPAADTVDAISTSKVHGIAGPFQDAIYVWRNGSMSGAFGTFEVYRWSGGVLDTITPPGYGASANNKYLGVHGHPDGTTLAFHLTNPGGVLTVLRSLDYGATWEALSPTYGVDFSGVGIQFGDSATGTSLRNNATVNPNNSSEWWATSVHNEKVNHSTDKGSTWVEESLPSGVTGSRGHILAV